MNWLIAILWVVGAFLGMQWLLALGSSQGVSLDLASRAAIQALVLVLVLVSLLARYAPAQPARGALGIRPSHPSLFWTGGMLGLSLKLPAESLRQTVEGWYPTPAETLAQQASLLTVDTWQRALGLGLALSILGPLTEELLFRGALYRPLARRYGALIAVSLTSALFVVVHGDWRAWLAMLIPASVLGVLRALSGSVMPSLAMHVSFNTATVVALVTGAASATQPLVAEDGAMPQVAVLASWLVSAGLLWLTYQLASTEEAAQARAEDDQ